MAVQASLVWPKIDEILEFEDFLDRFFPYHPVVPWNGQEPLPVIQGTLAQHSGLLYSYSGPGGMGLGGVCAYGKAPFCDFQAIFRLGANS